MTKILLILSFIFAGSFGFASRNDGGENPPLHFVVFHKPGPKWKAGASFRAQPGVQAHVNHWAQFQEDGKLSLGGPFLDSSGGMMVATKEISKEELTKYAEADPAVKSGLLVIEIKQWMIAMEKGK